MGLNYPVLSWFVYIVHEPAVTRASTNGLFQESATKDIGEAFRVWLKCLGLLQREAIEQMTVLQAL